MRMSKGFTLIELLIVIAIFAMLAAIAVPNFLEAQVRAKVARVKGDHRNLATALESYFIEETIVRASDAQATDHYGGSVSVHGDVALIGAPDEDGGAGDPVGGSGAAYIRRYDGSAWNEEEILRASDAQTNDFFGASVSIHGDVALVGANGENGGAGAAYVFRYDGSDWNEEEILRASDTQGTDEFGISVAVHGDVAVVGAWMEDGGAGDPLAVSGAAYVFRYDGSDWNEEEILRASDAQANDFFGFSVDLHGDVALVAALAEDGGAGDPADGSGAAYVFRYDGMSWSEEAILRASDAQAGDQFGLSASLHGDVAVVGAPLEDGGAGDPLDLSGAAYVFRYDGTSWNEEAILRASDAQADDEFAVSVAVHGDVALVGTNLEDGGAGDPLTLSGAAYVFRYDGSTWNEETILRASDAQGSDQFGGSVSFHGDVALIGALNEDGGAGDPTNSSGAAYIYRFKGSLDWFEEAIARASDAQASDDFGRTVSLHGDVALVGAWKEDGGAGDPIGASGAAYVYRYDGISWNEEAILRASDAATTDVFGNSVSVHGDVALIGATGAGVGGAVYVFRYDGTTWNEEQILSASDAQMDDSFGSAVSVNGDVALIGAVAEDGGPGDPLNIAGAAYIFRYNGATWVQEKILRASDTQVHDIFGVSVSVHGDVALVGAAFEDGGAGDPLDVSGAAYVFRYNGTTWVEEKILRASDAQASDQFGISVSVHGDVALVGANFEDGGAGDPIDGAGAAYVFRYGDTGSTTTWTQEATLRASDPGLQDFFGVSVSTHGDMALVGASLEDGGVGGSSPASGSAYVFRYDGANWMEEAILRASDAQASDFFGESVSVHGGVALVGAWQEDGGTSDPLDASGAAYFFRSLGDVINQSYSASANSWTGRLFGGLTEIGGNTLEGTWAQNANGLCMTVAAGGTNGVEWRSPKNLFSVAQRTVYRVSITMGTDQTTQGQVPVWDVNWSNIQDNFFLNFGGRRWFIDTEGGAQGIGLAEGPSEFTIFIAPTAIDTPQWNGEGAFAGTGAFTTEASANMGVRLIIRVLDFDDALQASARSGSVCIESVKVTGIPLEVLTDKTTEVYNEPLSSFTHRAFRGSTIVDPGTSASLDDMLNLYTLQHPAAADATVDPILATLGPDDQSQALFVNDPMVGNVRNPFRRFPVPSEANTTYITMADMYANSSESSPIDIIDFVNDAYTLEYGGSNWMTAGDDTLGTAGMPGAGSPKLKSNTGNVAPTWMDFVHVNNPTASVIENSQQWRPQIDFFSKSNIGITNPKDETGTDQLTIESFSVERLDVSFAP